MLQEFGPSLSQLGLLRVMRFYCDNSRRQGTECLVLGGMLRREIDEVIFRATTWRTLHKKKRKEIGQRSGTVRVVPDLEHDGLIIEDVALKFHWTFLGLCDTLAAAVRHRPLENKKQTCVIWPETGVPPSYTFDLHTW